MPPASLRRARWLVPLLFGAWSLWLGVDANWDLRNYHLYNAYAWLHGRLLTDLAPAGLQSYFNPLLDVPYYLASRTLPAPLVVFAMGAIQGLDFVLLLAIARITLANLSAADRIRVALALSIAGVLTGYFLSELGNTMGDNVTALLVLGALRIVVGGWETLVGGGRRAFVRAAMAGIVLGLAFGLKLTNGIYAVALCMSLLFVPGRAQSRVATAFVFGLAVLAGFAVTGGFWMHEMWSAFGNPFFPQFSAWFPNALARNVGVVDDQWLPHGLLATLAWPLLFSLDSHRVGHAAIHQAIWPIAYALFLAWVAVRLAARARGRATAAIDGPARVLVAFLAVSYVAWLATFGIARYLIAAELLAPLACYVLLAALVGDARGRVAAAWLVGASTALVLAGGVQTWGHEGLSMRAFRVDTPQVTRARDTAIVFAAGDPPWAWLAPFFPSAVSFVQVGGNFPEGPGYRARLDQILRDRPMRFTILPGERDFRREDVELANGYLRRLGISTSDRGCKALRWAVDRLHLRARVDARGGGASVRCELAERARDAPDVAAEDRREQERGAALLSAYGLALDADSCRSYRARIGRGVFVYQWCGLRAPVGPSSVR